MAKVKAQDNLKEALKEAIAESLTDNREFIQAIIKDVIEEAFLTRAIRDGKRTPKVSRDRVMKALMSA